MAERRRVKICNGFQVAEQFYSEIESRILSEGKRLDIRINTTQLMEGLFSRFGFNTYQVIKDGFGKGLDECRMKKSLGGKV